MANQNSGVVNTGGGSNTTTSTSTETNTLGSNTNSNFSNQGPAQSTVANNAGSGGTATSGEINNTDGTVDESTYVTETDPGITTAFQTFANDLTSEAETANDDNAEVAGESALTAQAATEASGALAAQVAGEASEEALQATKSPIQQIYPVLAIGALLFLGAIYFLTEGKKA